MSTTYRITCPWSLSGVHGNRERDCRAFFGPDVRFACTRASARGLCVELEGDHAEEWRQWVEQLRTFLRGRGYPAPLGIAVRPPGWSQGNPLPFFWLYGN